MIRNSAEKRTLLYKKNDSDLYTINHFVGCSHGCRYPCKAYFLKKSCGLINSYDDWIRPKVVPNALELLDEEIKKIKRKRNKQVYLCAETDPFMYQEELAGRLSLKIIERLNKAKIPCIILTKGIFPLTGITNIAIKYPTAFNNKFGISLISLDEKFRQDFEPGAAPYKLRIYSLKKLHELGFKTFVNIAPYPTPNIISQNFDQILNEIKFVDEIIFSKLIYNDEANNFKNKKNFYGRMLAKLGRFCFSQKISFKITAGTKFAQDFIYTKEQME